MKYLLEGLETKRVVFGLLNRKYFESWMALFRDPAVAPMLAMGYLDTPEEQCEEWFKRQENRYANGLGGMNVLLDKLSGELIGQAGLLVQEVDGVSELEVAYSLLPQSWGKGYATEAAMACRDQGFKRNHADSLISIIHIENIRSEKVARRNGMSLEKKSEYKGMPANIFRIFKADWLKHKELNPH